MDIKAIIAEITSRLAWRVEYQPNNTKDLEILSNPDTKTHIIYWPDNPKDPVRPIELLHELAHAALSERDLFLSGGVFDLNIPDYQYNLIPAVQAVDDWWADYLLDTWCTDAAREELSDHLELMQTALQGNSFYPHEFFGIAEIIAEGIYYLDAKINMPEHLQPAVQIFLDHPPDKPSRQATEEIVQCLFDVTGMNLQVVFIPGDEPHWTLTAKQDK